MAGNLVGSREAFERARAIVGQLPEENPRALQVAIAYADLLRWEWKLDESLAEAERVRAIHLKLHGADHRETAAAAQRVALAHLASVRNDEAVGIAGEVLPVVERIYSGDHVETAAAVFIMGEAARAKGDLVKAEELHRRALAIRERKLPANHPDLARSLARVADVLDARGSAGASALRERARAIEAARPGVPFDLV
jgi:hypothetical protein